MRYINKFSLLFILSLPLVSLSGAAQAQTGQAGMVREYFACNYLPGKDMDDLMAARDFMVEQLGDDLATTSFLWTPIMTDNQFDFLWFNQYDRVTDWGSGLQSLWGTARYEHIMQRFESMSDCVTGLVTHTPMFAGGSFQVTGSAAVVISFACNLKPGAQMSGVNDAVQHYTRVMSGMRSTHGNFNSFMQVPLVSSAGRDVFFFGVYPDLEAYAAGTAALQNSSEYAAVQAHFGQLQRCDTSLWEGRPIVQPQ